MRCNKARFITYVFILVWSVAAKAADVSVHSIVSNPSSYDHQPITLEGMAVAVKETTSQRGNDYTIFKLQDGGDSISIFTWGHSALGNGDRVRVEGIFEKEHHQGRYTFYNEVEASKVTPVH